MGAHVRGKARPWLQRLLRVRTGCACVFVCSGCYNKMSQTGWLKQQKFIFSQFWRPEVQDSGGVLADCPVSALPMGCRWLPSCCVCTRSFLDHVVVVGI